jgi:hypothetical protein
MSDRDSYAQVIDTIKALDAAQVIYPTMPVKDAAQEAVNLYHWALHDQAELEARGLDWALVEQLPVRAGALRFAEGEWYAVRFDRREAMERWLVEAAKGYELRDELVHIMLFAFRNHPELLARAQEVAEGSGHSDMLLDLSKAGALYAQNQPLFAQHAIDTTRFELAIQLSASLSDLLGQATGDQKTIDAAVDIRNRAFIYLKQAVDEIRAFGKFCFWRDEKRLQGYASDYHRKRSRHSSESDVDTPVASVSAG